MIESGGEWQVFEADRMLPMADSTVNCINRKILSIVGRDQLRT